MLERKKSLELKKHVGAIHSSNRLSLLQRKIANALLFNAYDQLLEKEEHEIHIPSLCHLIGYDSNDHKTIKKALINLLSTVIEWNLVDGDKTDATGVWNASSMIADASIDGAICTYSYSNRMKSLLHRPELYGRLNMLVQAKFQSSYGLALYENCIRFQNIEQTPWFDIFKFRKLMGVDDSQYKIFRDFKNRVLNKAVKEVNTHSPIFISPQFQKQGRQVVAIQFRITINSLSQKEQGDDKKVVGLSELLRDQFGLSKRQAENILSLYEEEYIREKIQVVKTSPAFLQGKISHLAKYIICALKDNYQIAKTTPTGPNNPPADTLLFSLNNHQEEYDRAQQKFLLTKFDSSPLKIKNEILKKFKTYLGKGAYLNIYLAKGLSDALIQNQLCMFIKQKHIEFLSSFISYQDFCLQKKNQDGKA